VLYELVKQFVEAAGPGVMKRLILDRGFLDGEAISLCKKQYGIDVSIPLRRNMDLYTDAMALFQEAEVEWVVCPEKGEKGKEGKECYQRKIMDPLAVSNWTRLEVACI
jgi:hypothetical protein